MTQADLAGGDYSKSYISAIEQGKSRPSLQALQRLASRLGVPPGQLLEPETSTAIPFDPDLLRRRVRKPRADRGGPLGVLLPESSKDFQLDRAELSIYTERPDEALRLLEPLLQAPAEGTPAAVQGSGRGRASRKADASSGSSSNVALAAGGGRQGTANQTLSQFLSLNLNRQQLQRALYLAALAHMQLGEASFASEYAQRGIQEATQNGDVEELARCRLVLGNAYRSAGQPLSAVEQHQASLDIATSGMVRDPQFRLAVLCELMEDYTTLRDKERARATYDESHTLIEELSRLEGHARLLWSAALEHNEAQHDTMARQVGGKAITLYQTLRSMRAVAKVLRTSSSLLAEQGELDEAEGQLQRSLTLAEGLNSSLDRVETLTELARLALQRGDIDGAVKQAEKAVQECRRLLDDGEDGGKRENVDAATKGAGEKPPANARRSLQVRAVLVRALGVVGEAATRQEDESRADEAFLEALRLLETGVRVEKASEIYRSYAQVLATRGDHEKALYYFERAYDSVARKLG
ncbi:MAG: tetratricopeptide repeat protein [Chloroflexota bacterium]|nr:tetratricopeptide repeat protein [Chloroflexota bacterium]